MKDTTHFVKMAITFVASLISDWSGLSVLMIIYGREIGQEQQKISSKTGTPIAKLGMKGFNLFRWSKGNRLDFLLSVAGFFAGLAIRHLIFLII